MKKSIAFLLIGILIGTILGSFLFREVKAEYYDEIYYLKNIYNILSSIDSDVSSINSNVSDIRNAVNWIVY